MNKSVIVSFMSIGILVASCAKADDTPTKINAPGPVGAEPSAPCKPDYQPKFKVCKETTNILGMSTRTTTFRPEAGTQLCDPDAAHYCSEVSATDVINTLKSSKGVVPENVTLKNSRSEFVSDIPRCGGVLHAHNKSDVFCDFEYKQPAYEIIADASCGVDHIEDANGCYSKEHLKVTVSNEDIKGCLSFVPENEVDKETKKKCVNDIYKAQKEYRITLPSDLQDAAVSEERASKM